MARTARTTSWSDPLDEPLEGLGTFGDDPAYRPAWRPTNPPTPRPAAGLLPRHTDENGTTWYLLGLRTLALGGTWSNLGGSIDKGEHPLAAAMREFYEEAGEPISACGEGHLTQVVTDCGTAAKPYTLYVVDVDDTYDGFQIGWENDDLAWWSADAIDGLNLHAGFARAWATIRNH